MGPVSEGVRGNTLRKGQLENTSLKPPSLPEATYKFSKNGSIWLRSGCLVCKRNLGPPTCPLPWKGYIIAKGIPPQEVSKITPDIKKSHAQNGFFQRRRIKAE